jgi:ubiquinone/menaquinone biosynthesis C-methylase UbiE
MKKIIKSIIPPLFIYFYKKIFYFFFIKFNSLKVKNNQQDIRIYDDNETADRLTYWGRDSTWNEILMLINNKEGRILDLACGNGLNMQELKKYNPKANFFGCDISKKLIDIAIRKYGIDSQNLSCIDATLMDYPENYFNYSYSIGSLEHFTENGIEQVIDKIFQNTSKISFHMMPVSKDNKNQGWIKTYQTFHNNSVEWWLNKFKKKYNKVLVINSAWNDFISVGKWFICIKNND